ncbi:MAG: ABC transporter ATP-binding protein [Burkholderiales bacterium]
MNAITQPLLQVENLRKLFTVGTSGLHFGGAKIVHRLHAVDDVSFAIASGESVGLVGESGCGKSTLVRLLARLADPTDGGIRFEGRAIHETPASKFARNADRGLIQMVFQDPTDSLNPRFTAFDAIAEPLRRLSAPSNANELRQRVAELADQVGLPPELLPRFPHQLSGGQKARVGIARAIAVKPRLLILDEPTAALDVSVQAIILHLLADLREQLGMSYLFVSHDLNIVRLLCQRVLVMYLGKIVESGPIEDVFNHPLHPYTQALVSAIPNMGEKKERINLPGEPRSPIDPDPRVCRFFGRCHLAGGRCDTEEPKLHEPRPGRQVACHYPVGTLPHLIAKGTKR